MRCTILSYCNSCVLLYIETVKVAQHVFMEVYVHPLDLYTSESHVSLLVQAQ